MPGMNRAISQPIVNRCNMSKRPTMKKIIPTKYMLPRCVDTSLSDSELKRTTSDNIPLVDRLLILLIRLHKPFANANKAAIHEAALQQVVDGFEQQRATFI